MLTWPTILLALMVCREVPREPAYVQHAVAQTVLNRVAHPGWWGHDIPSVILTPYQYSTMTAPGDPQLTQWPTSQAWSRCVDSAQDVLNLAVPIVAPGADSFYATTIPAPEWATKDRFVVQIGRLKFYNMDGR